LYPPPAPLLRVQHPVMIDISTAMATAVAMHSTAHSSVEAGYQQGAAESDTSVATKKGMNEN